MSKSKTSSPAVDRGLEVERVEVSTLLNDPANVRKHNERNLESIKASLARFGQQKPIVVGRDGVVIAGNGTLAAARSLGWSTIDIVRSHLTGAEATAYAIADNRTAELAEWDEDALAQQLAALQIEDEELLAATGFDEKELEAMSGPAEVEEDEVPEPPADPITKPGYLWILGGHRLLCGDSTKAEDVERLMAGAKADLCFTSPPYGQQRDYTEEGKAKVADWDGLMRGVFANLPMTEAGQVLVNLGLIHREGEWIPYWDGWIGWMRNQGWKRFGWYVWDKKHPSPMKDRGRLLPQHEWIFHFNRKPKSCEKTVPCVTAGRLQTFGLKSAAGTQADLGSAVTQDFRVLGSVISIAPEDGRMNGNPHPAQFPIKFAATVIEIWTLESESVYEPFCGSGTTLIAAEQLGRKCYGMEISPAYCDVIVKRWETLTGKKAERGA